MEKTYKRVPFDIELAKKIQAGEVEGRIVTEYGGWGGKAFEYIELPEETPKQHCGDMCGDNRFKIIEVAKKHILDETNIDSRPEEMAVLDNILFRCWQMGWLKCYEQEVSKKETLKHEFKVGDKIRVDFSEERLLEMKINGCYQGNILTVTRIQPYGVNAKGGNIKETFFMFDDIEPFEFKVGDYVKYGKYEEKLKIVKIDDSLPSNVWVEIKTLDGNISMKCPLCEIEPFKEVKHEFKPFDKVLVRDSIKGFWLPKFFSETLPEEEYLDCGYRHKIKSYRVLLLFLVKIII